MEYYGKILCISVDDLTRDDSIKESDGLGPIMSKSNYDQHVFRKKINVVRPGKGLGNYALVEVDSLPPRFKERVKQKYPEGSEMKIRQFLDGNYKVDDKARKWFSEFRFDNGMPIPPATQKEYVANASILNVVLAMFNDMKAMRKAMQGSTVKWSELSGAISFYKEEYGHDLPNSVSRIQKKVTQYKKDGYQVLISGKFRNQNTRKVSYQTERLILSLDSLPTRPFNSSVAEMYNMFVNGILEVVDPQTGEIFQPEDFRDKTGEPLILSESTIANYLNNPMNRIIRANLHATQWDFNGKYAPHHLRKSPYFAFSKISMDDRDLPRKMNNGNRVKAYYAYDVASGCVIGYSYNRDKTRELFIDCVRNMFQMIDKNGWNTPAEVEVEHHIVNNYADGLMKAKVIFPFVRWCNPGNSQEKRAEHFNRSKKYTVEKQSQSNIGRWYAKLETNQPKIEKVYDEKNNTYKEKTFTFDELVADDLAAIAEYNNRPHPNQKKYPGMTRWGVLSLLQNPDLEPVDKAILYRFIGEHTQTTINRSMYCKVQYKEYCLSHPSIMEKLDARNYTVDAYYLPDANGDINEVYIYQNEYLIDTCSVIERYNEAKIERTDKDEESYIKQAAYTAQFRKMVKDKKEEMITKVVIVKPEEKKYIQSLIAEEVTMPEELETGYNPCDFSDYMNEDYMKRMALEAV